MSDLLSQEEIDLLLKSGLADQAQDDVAEEAPRPAPKKPSYSSASASASMPSFDQMQGGGESKTKHQRSAKLDRSVQVQPAVFVPFDEEEPAMETTNLDVILNLDLEIRVELGKTRKTVRDILEMGSGSVLELNKLNGEPVDLLVNARGFAKGEMIVIGENFGVRVTDILSVTEIIEALK